MTVIVSDTFNRANTTQDWGTADTGGAWIHSSDDVTHVKIAANKGRILHTGVGGNHSCQIYGSNVADSESLVTFTTDVWGSTLIKVAARITANHGDHYFARIAGANKRIYKRVAGVDTQLGTVIFTFAINTNYKLRFRVEGTALKLRVWVAVDAEPGTWDIEVTDTALATGRFGMQRVFMDTVVNADFEDYSVDDLVVAAVTVPEMMAARQGGAQPAMIPVGVTSY